MSEKGNAKSRKSFLVIGCGSIGNRHLANLKTIGVSNLGVFDVNRSRCEKIREKYKIAVFFDLDEALSENFDVALICSPTSLHLTHALLAANAGCHLFIEKPVSHELDGLTHLLNLIRKKKLISLVGCNLRFHPGMIKIHSLIEKKEIGRILTARAQFGQYLPDWHPWEDYRNSYSAQNTLGGGVILDRIHEIDYMRWLFGGVSEVTAMAGHISDLEIDTEDVAEIILRFSNGAFGSLHLDYIRRTYDASLEILGDKGIIKWNYQNHSIEWFIADKSRWNSIKWECFDGNQMYVDEMKHFLRVLDGKEVTTLSADDAAEDLKIAIAVKDAAKNQIVIRI